MYIIDSRRIATLKSRLGEAANLISNDSFLPMFRNRQKNHPEEFEYSIKLARDKRKPSRFFATIWSRKNLAKTLGWIRAKLDKLKAKREDRRLERKKQAEALKLQKEYNPVGRARLNALFEEKLAHFRI